MSHVSLDYFRLPSSNVTLVHPKKSRKSSKRKQSSTNLKKNDQSSRSSNKKESKKGYDRVKEQKKRHERSFQKKALSGKVCAVCLDEKSLDLMLLPCAHVFHGECISKWVRNNFSCPLCRQEIAQFVPLKFAKSTMKEFEELWLQHYSGNGNNRDKKRDILETNDSDKVCVNEKEHSVVAKSDETVANKTIEIDKQEQEQEQEQEQKQVEKQIENWSVTAYSNGESIDNVMFAGVSDCDSVCTSNTCDVLAATRVVQQEQEEEEEEQKRHEESYSSPMAENVQFQQMEAVSLGCKGNVVKQNLTSLWSFVWSNTLAMPLVVKKKSRCNVVKDMGIGSYMIERTIMDNATSTWEMSACDYHSPQLQSGMIRNHLSSEQEELIFEEEEKEKDRLLPLTKEWSEMQDSKHKNDEKLVESPRQTDSSSWKQLWINSRAGACGGVAATLTTVGMTTELKKNRFFGARTLALQTIPCVTLYFSMYEYLKQNLFHTDGENKCWHRTFAERFVAAGVAGSLVSWSAPNTSLLLGLRYAAFFGSFELFKDMMSQYVDHKRQLHFSEVALTAGAGGVVASTLYYPVLQLSLHSQPLQMSAANHVMPFPTQIRQILFQNVTFEALFRGFGSHLTKFLPSCVACSCAFEFSRRHFAHQSSSE